MEQAPFGSDLSAGHPSSHVHRYTSYLTDLKTKNWAYASSQRVPARNKRERRTYWNHQDTRAGAAEK